MQVMTSDPFGTVDMSLRGQLRARQEQIAQADPPPAVAQAPAPPRANRDLDRTRKASAARHAQAMRDLHASLRGVGREMAHMKQAVYSAHALDRGVKAAGPTRMPAAGTGPTSDNATTGGTAELAVQVQDLSASLWKGVRFDGLA